MISRSRVQRFNHCTTEPPAVDQHDQLIQVCVENGCKVVHVDVFMQVKLTEDDKNKAKQDLDDTNKALTDKTAAETKAKEDLDKLKKEKVKLLISAIQSLHAS